MLLSLPVLNIFEEALNHLYLVGWWIYERDYVFLRLCVAFGLKDILLFFAGVLKKASSFKDELKRKIIRRTPSMSRSRESREDPPLSPSKNRKHVVSPKRSLRLQKNSFADAGSSITKKSPKLIKRRGLQRGSSFSEGTNRVSKSEKKEQQAGGVSINSEIVICLNGYLHI